MPTIKKSKEQIKDIARAGKIVASCHEQLKKRVVPGVKTSELDQFIDWYLTEQGAVPAQKGYKGYPYASCISVNEVACHGFPGDYMLKDGDIVTIDLVADVNGWKADSAWTYIVGKGAAEVQRLLRAAKAALAAGIKAAKAGNQVSDIGAAIEDSVRSHGYKVITAFAGHGIGKEIHESPQVLHGRLPQVPFLLEEGMVITIEPILSAGSNGIYIARDGWTARTIDHSLTAQFEHTLVITNGAPLLLTAHTSSNKNRQQGKTTAKAVKPKATQTKQVRATTSKPKATQPKQERATTSKPLLVNGIVKSGRITKARD